MLVLGLRFELPGPVHGGIGHFQSGSDNAQAHRKIGDEGFLFHAVAVSERVSVRENVTQDGPSVDAGTEKNASGDRQTVGFWLGNVPLSHPWRMAQLP